MNNLEEIRKELFGKGRWTFGGDGSHWDGCAESHWDCKLVQLTADNAKLKEQNDTWKTMAKQWDDRLGKQVAENAKLRELLGEVWKAVDYLDIHHSYRELLSRIQSALREE